MKNKKRGFSLIEVVMALAVISVGVLPILSMYPSALKMTTKATAIEEWSRVNMSIVDYIKSRGYDNLKSNLIWSSNAIDEEYNFEKLGTNYTNINFEKDFLGLESATTQPSLFFINSKGINLENYKFSIYMEDIQPTSGGIEIYKKYDLNNNKFDSSSTYSSIIYGIIKKKKKDSSGNADFSGEESIKDMKFIITPIENWRD